MVTFDKYLLACQGQGIEEDTATIVWQILLKLRNEKRKDNV